MATFIELVNRGNLRMVQRRHAEAADCYRYALQIEPHHAGVYNNLGLALKNLGQLDSAILCYRKALEFDANSADALDNLSMAFREQGNLGEAETACRRALHVAPGHAGAHNSLGLILGDLGRHAEAISSFRQALRLHPLRVHVYNNLGTALLASGDRKKSAACFRKALQLDPHYINAHINLGTVLKDEAKLDDAAICYQQALASDPRSADALTNLGNVFKDQGKLEEAASYHRQALMSDPKHVEARNNLGSLLIDLGRREEAAKCFAEALRQKPGHVSTRWNRAVLGLLEGRLPESWQDYECRWQATGAKERHAHWPRWDGSPLVGKTILLHAEQGLGDTIQFVRYAPLVKQRGGNVVLECQPPLKRLLGGAAGVDHLVAAGEMLPSFDVQAPLMSLPAILGTSLQTVPANVPYLHADVGTAEHWRTELASLHGFKVGIAWQGSPAHKGDRYRSIPLPLFASLAAIDGTCLVSLQKGPGADQLHALERQSNILDLGERLDAAGAFLDTSAIIRNLDLVIAVDSAVAHVSGALGAATWLLLSAAPDWRWLLDRADSPWYPTIRLFRQTRLGDWSEVFERVKQELLECGEKWRMKNRE